MAEDKKLTTITPQEIKDIAPLSEVYEMSKYSKYLVVIEASNLAGGWELAHQRAKQVAATLLKLEMKFAIILVPTGGMDGIKFYDFKEEKK